MAHKKGMGSTRNGRDSESKRLGVKRADGQSVNAGDVIMTITQESIDTARTELTDAVSDAELALTQAKIEESETLLTAKYEYDTRIAEGSAAESVYNAELEKIRLSDMLGPSCEREEEQPSPESTSST